MKIEDFKLNTRVKYLDVVGEVIFLDIANGALAVKFESGVPYKGYDAKRTTWLFGGGGTSVDLDVLTILD
ncbi:MAG: hypothetical protein E6R13_02355 [Spirochaetes bacterium]|nr:MAG: hypothetical protein E6R13_02355 [Spirochaetota bacterium]